MLSVKIGSSIILTDPGISLPLVLRSPLFLTGEGKVPGSYIFNNSVPADDAIRKEYNQAHRVQRHGRATAELPYSIRHGSLHYQGNVVLTQADQDKYDTSYKIDNGDFAAKLGLKTLKDLDWGTEYIISSPSSNNCKAETNVDKGLQSSVNYPLVAFSEIFPLVLDVIVVNSNNNLNIAASTYTVPETGKFLFNMDLDISLMWGALQLHVEKNGSSFFSTGLGPGANTWTEIIELVAGDVLHYYITAQSMGNGNEQDPLSYTQENIDFAILSGSSISFTGNNSVLSGITAKDQYSSEYAVFPILNPGLLSNFPDDAFQLDNLSIKTLYSQYFPVQNYYKDGEFPLFIVGFIEGQQYSVANLFTPFVYFRTILNKIASEAGYHIVNNPFENPDFENAILYNAFAENNYTNGNTTLLPVKPNFTLMDHVPAMLQGDFLNSIAQLTGSMPVIDNNNLTITFVPLRTIHIESATNPAIDFPGILLPNPINKIEPEYKGIKFELKKAGSDAYLERSITELNVKMNYKGSLYDMRELLPLTGCVVGDYYLITSNNEYYIYKYLPDVYALGWTFFSKKFPIIYTEGEEPFLKVTTEFCPILSSHFTDDVLGAPTSNLYGIPPNQIIGPPYPRSWTLPRTEQPGILEGFPESLNGEYGLQILFYKGMSTDSLGQTYPLGSSRLADYSPPASGGTDLNAESIFNSRYKEFLRWLAYDAKPATYKAIITPAQLKQINFARIYQGNGFSFLIKEIRVNMLQDGLSMAEVDVYIC